MIFQHTISHGNMPQTMFSLYSGKLTVPAEFKIPLQSQILKIFII